MVAPPGSLLVVSHPAVVEVNQDLYAHLVASGMEVQLIVPAHWHHPYAPSGFTAAVHPGLVGRVHRVEVFGEGRPQRHLYRTRPRRWLRPGPAALYLEEECFSIPAMQWGLAASRQGIPFGLQAWENLDRPLPAPVKALRTALLRRASFIVARTPAAAERVRAWGATGVVEVVESPVPSLDVPAPNHPRPFTVGYVGRLVPEKGVLDLAQAIEAVPEARLLIVGDGPLRNDLTGRPRVELRAAVDHRSIGAIYAELDVLVLPSRTTATWAEQFGRVLVEAMSAGVAVVGSDSGEIPWVINSTGGGLVVPEGDVHALGAALRSLALDPARCQALAAAGRRATASRFTLAHSAAGLARLVEPFGVTSGG